jgi:hypothetical protein
VEGLQSLFTRVLYKEPKPPALADNSIKKNNVSMPSARMKPMGASMMSIVSYMSFCTFLGIICCFMVMCSYRCVCCCFTVL